MTSRDRSSSSSSSGSSDSDSSQHDDIIRSAAAAAFLGMAVTVNSSSPGTRTMYTDTERGAKFTSQLLDPEGSGQRIKNMTRMELTTFKELVLWMKTHTELKDSAPERWNTITAEQKVLIFLYITSQGVSYRNAAEMFNHSLDTISTIFHEVLEAASILHEKTVRIPPAEYSEKSLGNETKCWPFLRGCIGALDGSHLAISVPLEKRGQWRNRKEWISQNILAACDFDMNFVYIYAGAEGSAHDSRVLSFAEKRDNLANQIPENCYFLADAGYSNTNSLLITPYNGVRYHLKEFEKVGKRPANAKELFNLRHASKRSVIERAFGVFKRRFQIYDRPRDGYSIETQVKLVFALTAIHNFMNHCGEDTSYEEDSEDEAEDENEVVEPALASRRVDMVIKRDEISKDMWIQYRRILAEREVRTLQRED